MTDEQLAAVLTALGSKTNSKAIVLVDDPNPKQVFISVKGNTWTGIVLRPDGSILIKEGKLA